MRDLACVALAACALAVAAPRAAAQGADVRRQAAAHLAAGEYDQALAAIEQGLASDPDDAALLNLRAKAFMDLRDFAQALGAYEQVAKVSKGANRRAAQRIVASLEDVRTTFVEVTVASGSASIYLDSKSLGVWCVAAPTCTRGMVPGYYRLIIEADGHRPLKKNVTIKAGTTTRLAETLIARPSALTVTARQPGAEVELDGKPLGPAPQRAEIEPGEHRLRVTLDGHVPHEQAVTAAAGAPVEIDVELGTWLEVAVTPADAELVIAGAPARRDGRRVALPPGGPHAITARAPGHVEQTIELPATRTAGQVVELVLAREVRPLVVRGPRGATVTIDGQVRGALPLPAALELPAGEHVVEIRTPGAAPYRSTLQLDAASQLDVGLHAPERRIRRRVWVAGGVAAVGLASGLAFGYLALDAANQHDDRARQPGVTVDDPELAELDDRIGRFALMSDLGMGVALAAAGAGAYFLVQDLRASEGATLRATISPTGATVSGRF